MRSVGVSAYSEDVFPGFHLGFHRQGNAPWVDPLDVMAASARHSHGRHALRFEKSVKPNSWVGQFLCVEQLPFSTGQQEGVGHAEVLPDWSRGQGGAVLEFAVNCRWRR